MRACQLCGETNNLQQKHRHLLQTYVTGGRFEHIAGDIAGPNPKSVSDKSYILVIKIFPLPYQAWGQLHRHLLNCYYMDLGKCNSLLAITLPNVINYILGADNDFRFCWKEPVVLSYFYKYVHIKCYVMLDI